MKTARVQHACIVSPNNQLYAIGGANEWTSLASIEFISTINIQSKQWSYTNQSLSQTVIGANTAILGNNIYIIGGFYSTSEINKVRTYYQFTH